MDVIPFEQLPTEMFQLRAKVDDTYKLLFEFVNRNKQEPEPDICDINVAAKITCKAPGTLYQLVHKNRIPFYKKSGKLYFSRKQLTAWIESGKHISPEQQANDQRESAGRKRNGGR